MREIGDMRNVVIHEYFGVDLEILWETIQHELPPLNAVITENAAEDPQPDS